MKLYGSYTSPFVRHCRIALLESNMTAEFIETDAKTSAQLSPTQKVPFLVIDDKHTLTDSSAILKYIREASGNTYFQESEGCEHYNQYCTANTLLDTALNVFFLEKDGILSANSAYLQRQQSRIQSGLEQLEQLNLAAEAPYHDGELRIACFLDWALFRNRINVDGYPRLNAFLQSIRQYPYFTQTAPKG